MSELPRSVSTPISIRIPRRSQDWCVAFGEGAGLKEIPLSGGLVTIDTDNGIHHVMACEGDVGGDATEEFTNRLASLVAAE
jgi:hypothetical protein